MVFFEVGDGEAGEVEGAVEVDVDYVGYACGGLILQEQEGWVNDVSCYSAAIER